MQSFESAFGGEEEETSENSERVFESEKVKNAPLKEMICRFPVIDEDQVEVRMNEERKQEWV